MWTRHKEFAAATDEDLSLAQSIRESAAQRLRDMALKEQERDIAVLTAARVGGAVSEDRRSLMLTPEQLMRIMQACIKGQLTVQWGPQGPMSVTLDP